MTSQHQESVEILNVLFSNWKDEHRQLDKFVQELGTWVTDDAQRLTPQFREAANRLRGLSERLSQHFAKEQDIGELLAEARGIATPQIESAQRQAGKDHRALTERLNKLIDGMESSSGLVEDWKRFTNEFNLFIDVLEQHEELEAESVRRLIPATQLD
jgi:iron-sulfur cluster repair protein YtfE (RIC family)